MMVFLVRSSFVAVHVWLMFRLCYDLEHPKT
jgi:hypothetical protein